ncbi:hypothetical protein CBR_g38236 [Chara braunii]|uniref:RNA-directed DNA polymerase n=1 Tax=Chara braunii TaxID=69332 RepID=A0A388LPU7_CHABU|nr:hypothetical protein CBR_g38236 [Chara braunii]|eukprot:GBG84265.1 hypothetical protein CBR_g38236 [Chara braunii]
MDAEARIEEAREFPRDRQGYRPLRREEEECQDRRDLREGRSVEVGGRPRRWVERIPEAVAGERQALVGQRADAEMRMPAREGAIEGSRGLPIESRWADLPDARMGEALEFPRDRVGYRPPRREEEGGPSRRDLRDERPAEAGSRPRRWVKRESDAAWASSEITGRSQGVEAWKSFRGQDHTRWKTDWPNEQGRYGEDLSRPSRPRARMEEPDPSWYKSYGPTIDGPMEGPYFRRYDDRRVPYYNVNLGLETLFFDGRDVTGFVEKWESYAYRKRFSEREWIDYFIQHSDPELDPAIRAIYPADGRWRTFRTSLLRTFACDDLIPTVEGLRRITRGERKSLVAFTRRFKRMSQALVDRGMLSEVDRCVMFMLHLPEEKRKEVLEKAPRDSANFEKVTEVVFTGGGVDVREYMKETLDMALCNMRGTRNDGPRRSDRPPPGPPGPRWGERPTGWRNESSGQGGWRNNQEIGRNRGSDWGSSHWKDAKDGRWGDAPQARASGPRPEVRAPPPPAPPPSAPPALIVKATQGGPRPNNPQARSGCVYCNEENHIKRDCPYLTEALRLGVVKLNKNKWVVWGDSGEAVSFYPSMKVNVDKRMALQEARLVKKPKVGSSSNTAHIQMTESPGGLSSRESQVSSIKFIETQPEKERPCLRVRTQVGTGTSESQGSVTEGTECTLLEYLAASKSVREELLNITRKVRVPLAGGPTVPVEGSTKEEVQASRITMEELPADFFSCEEAKKFYVLASGQLQTVVSGKTMSVLVDNGSESTVCRDFIARELGLEIDRGVSMSMVVADNKLQPAEGVCHSPVIEVAGVEATVLIFSVKECSSELILGRTWLSAVHATTVDLPDGSYTLSIQNPDGIRVVLKTVDAQDERNRTSIARRKGSQSRVCRVRLEEVPLADRGPKGDQLEVEHVGYRTVINEVRQFLGVVGYWRIFIKAYGEKAEPLRRLLRKSEGWVWGEEQAATMETLKGEFREGGEVLGVPFFKDEEHRPFIVSTDAGLQWVGGLLSQKDGEGKERPLRFESRTLNPAERNYSQFKKEVLGVLHCLKVFRHYLYRRRFLLRVDPTAVAAVLQEDFSLTDPTIARWMIHIRLYDYKVKRISGTKNQVANGLSRLPIREEDPPRLKKEAVTMVEGEVMKVATNRARVAEISRGEEEAPRTFLANLYDGKYRDIGLYLAGRETGTERIRQEALGYCLRGGHLFKRPTKFAIPMRVLCDPDERRAVIEELHDWLVGGHRGVKGTFDKVRRLYWWDGQYTEVEKYCSMCEACQKRATVRYKELLVPSLPTIPSEKVHVDLVTMPKGVGRLRYIINIRDDLTGFVEAKAIKKKTAEEVSDFLLEYIARYGCVGRIIMDRGA